MPREKKNGQFINIYLRKDLFEQLDKFCTSNGVTKTFAVEKGIELYLEKHNSEQTNDGQKNI